MIFIFIGQVENSETSEISEILFRVFLFPSFRVCPTAKIKNSDLKISEKNFRVFRVFDLAYVGVSFLKKIDGFSVKDAYELIL